ncbi:NADP-dependent oxidoreductase [Rhodococcus spelaei]|uniref:NADP-dependent oxidoreductase n=1 Tax=Rhodococcus spelaei TaxID=2546320 RepID=A0A541B9Z6_9NOCA|nr:NADP-dependent oxidoreductase [Rhodococcus spelaei]TQF69093.1 NADP-dependent oxidoreductase [Rhodococcus spelaei]
MANSVVATAFGGPEVLTVIDEPVPAPGTGQVQVELRAVGVNPFDFKTYSGAFGSDPATLPVRPGLEGAGVVVAVGEGAAGPAGPLAVGDEVILHPGKGTYTQLLNLDAGDVLPKPSTLPWEQAAGLLATGTTAVDALTTARVGAGDTLLIHGAAGAVGALTVQLAVARGATVIGTARESKHDYLRSLGAVPVAYGDGLLDRVRAAAPNGVDAAFDTAGTDEAIDTSLALVSDRDRIVTIVAFGRAAQDGFPAIGAGSPESTRIRFEARSELIELAGRGKLDVLVAKTFPLDAAAQAHVELQGPHASGKFVLLP